MKVAIDNSDAVIEGSIDLSDELKDYMAASGKPVLDYKAHILSSIKMTFYNKSQF